MTERRTSRARFPSRTPACEGMLTSRCDVALLDSHRRSGSSLALQNGSVATSAAEVRTAGVPLHAASLAAAARKSVCDASTAFAVRTAHAPHAAAASLAVHSAASYIRSPMRRMRFDVPSRECSWLHDLQRLRRTIVRAHGAHAGSRGGDVWKHEEFAQRRKSVIKAAHRRELPCACMVSDLPPTLI
jgi:hypothetical protein